MALRSEFCQTIVGHAAQRWKLRDVRDALAASEDKTTRPTLIAKTFAEGCATTETRFFSQDRVMPNEGRQ